MHVFECILKMGHAGSGKNTEKAVRVRARDIVQAMRRAKSLPGVKKGGLWASGGSVMRVQMLH